MSFNRHAAKRLSEKMSRRAKLGWIIRRKRMAERGPREDERPRRLDAGEYLGSLQWHGADGSVKRWPVFQAKRRNQIIVRGMKEPHGWDFVLNKLREKLSMLTR
jgi:hypothetical protein